MSMLTSDPVLFHTLRNHFRTTVHEVAVAVSRSAYSPLTAGTGSGGGGGDSDDAIMAANGDLIATNERAFVHMASLPTGLKHVLKEFPLDQVREGDVYANNNPYFGAIHSNDVCIFRPVFFDGVVEYWVGSLTHIADVGGMSPGGISVGATSVFGEGLLIPPIKLFEAGELNEAVMAIIGSNSRTPILTTGDVLALVSGANVGAKRISDLLTRYGADTVREMVTELFEYTEKLTRDNISLLKDGTYTDQVWCDDDGIDRDNHYFVKATVTVDGDRLTVDLDGSSPQVRGSTNASYSQSLTAVTFATKVFVGRDVPLNEGFWRAIDIRLPLGSVVNPSPGAPCNTRMANTVPAIVEAVLWALGPSGSEDIGRAAGGGVPDVHAINPAAGEPWLHFDCLWGGYGARNCKDGVDAAGNPFLGGAGSGIMGIEASELAYDLFCEGFFLRPDSGGAGRYRGGLGIRQDYRLLRDSILSVRTDRWIYPPSGLEGGEAGSAGAYTINPGSADEVHLPSKQGDIPVKAGSLVSFETVGGGGYGPPATRPSEDVLIDVEFGRVSIVGAREQYGVVIDEHTDGRLAVDEAATEVARKAMVG